MTFRIGVDVGGTNTDAVVVGSDRRVLASAKTPTTTDPMTGIREALGQVLHASRIDPAQVSHAMLGTTHCTNAIVERAHLDRVGVLRLCLPAADSVLPHADWPADLVAAVGQQVAMVHGGYQIDGAPISELHPVEIEAALSAMAGAVDTLAVTGVSSPARPDQELAVASIAERVLPGVRVSLSHRIGSLGFVERENATILNAALQTVIRGVVTGFSRALSDLGLHPRVYIGQNDGTLMSTGAAADYPVLTIGCGPTNSIRGAAILAGLEDLVVVDVGGTTTDLGVMARGELRQSSVAATVGGVRTNFRMPDVLSIGLGGGSIVAADGTTVGPRSVGYRLLEAARSFGGDTPTATDAALARGRVRIAGARTGGTDLAWADTVLARCSGMVAEALDEMRTSAAAVNVVVVGGGGFLVPDDLAGAARVIRPPHLEVANAIGAALGRVSGEVEQIYSLDGQRYEDIIANAREVAIRRAEANGARPSSIEVIDVEDVPLAYMPGNSIRVRVRAVGDLEES